MAGPSRLQALKSAYETSPLAPEATVRQVAWLHLGDYSNASVLLGLSPGAGEGADYIYSTVSASGVRYFGTPLAKMGVFEGDVRFLRTPLALCD